MAQSNNGQKLTPTLGGNIVVEEANGRIVLNDGTRFRLILGILPDGSIGLVVSKPDEDVFGAFS